MVPLTNFEMVFERVNPNTNFGIAPRVVRRIPSEADTSVRRNTTLYSYQREETMPKLVCG